MLPTAMGAERTSSMILYDNDRGLETENFNCPAVTYRGVSPVKTTVSCTCRESSALCDSHVGVSSGGEPLSGQTDDVQTRRQLVEEPWVT